MFSVDLFKSIVRFISLNGDDRLETLLLMSNRLVKMREQSIYLDEGDKPAAKKEINSYEKRFKLWNKVHNRLPY
jgi:hypothetical protein